MKIRWMLLPTKVFTLYQAVCVLASRSNLCYLQSDTLPFWIYNFCSIGTFSSTYHDLQIILTTQNNFYPCACVIDYEWKRKSSDFSFTCSHVHHPLGKSWFRIKITGFSQMLCQISAQRSVMVTVFLYWLHEYYVISLQWILIDSDFPIKHIALSEDYTYVVSVCPSPMENMI